MDKPTCSCQPPPRGIRRHRPVFRLCRRAGWSLVIGSSLMVLLWAGVNWRGKSVWRKCRAELQAKGAILDWAGLCPPAVPDEQNFFKAPKMSEWFEGGDRELAEKLSSGGLKSNKLSLGANVLAEVTIVEPAARVPEGTADVVLDYHDSVLELSTFGEVPSTAPAPGSMVIPLIRFERVSIFDAIRDLAYQAGLKLAIDPHLASSLQRKAVSMRWENLTARQALVRSLSLWGLHLVGDARTGTAKITSDDPAGPRVKVGVAARARIEALTQSALQQGGNPVPVVGLLGAQNLGLFAQPLKPLIPLHVVVRTDEPLTGNLIGQFLPAGPLAALNQASPFIRVEQSESDTFWVLMNPVNYNTAAGYLAWSDSCLPEFDRIQAALQRPYAFRDGRLLKPPAMAMPSYVNLRMVAQELCQRAQCHLLLNQPEAALRELTLVHDLCRALNGKPTTVVATMMHAAVTGLYVRVVSDGLRMNAWQEPQLAVIERQLREVQLVAPMVEAFQYERLNLLCLLEGGQIGKLAREFEKYNPPAPDESPGLLKLKRAGYSLLPLLPQGWVFESMATTGWRYQGYLEAVDPGRGIINLGGIEAAANRNREVLKLRRPGNILASIGAPDFSRLWQVLAHQQTLANQAAMACALERHRLARGRYPESLEALVPEFAATVSLDVINGRSLRYQLTADGGYLLYSVGWNGTDDGGTVCRSENGFTKDLRDGDWVWTTAAD